MFGYLGPSSGLWASAQLLAVVKAAAVVIIKNLDGISCAPGSSVAHAMTPQLGFSPRERTGSWRVPRAGK
jgi:hypothetical protein